MLVIVSSAIAGVITATYLSNPSVPFILLFFWACEKNEIAQSVSQMTFAEEKSAHANDSSRKKVACKTNSGITAVFTTYSVYGTSPWPWWQFDVKTEVKMWPCRKINWKYLWAVIQLWHFCLKTKGMCGTDYNRNLGCSDLEMWDPLQRNFSSYY